MKPCPFCGSRDTAIYRNEKLHQEWGYWVRCRTCNAQGPASNSIAEAEERWGQRPTEATESLGAYPDGDGRS